MTAGPGVASIRIKAAQEGEELVFAISADDITREEIEHRVPFRSPCGIASGEFACGTEKVAVVEVVIIELVIAAKTRWITNERAPGWFESEETLGVAGREKILHRRAQPLVAFLHGTFVPSLLGERQQRGPFAELLAEPVGVAGELRSAGEFLIDKFAQFRLVHTGGKRQRRQHGGKFHRRGEA